MTLSVMGLVSKPGLKSEIFPFMDRETAKGLVTLTISRIEGGSELARSPEYPQRIRVASVFEPSVLCVSA